MKTLVLGASHKPERYSNMAVKRLHSFNHQVVALGRRARQVDDWEIVTGQPELEDVHTVTLYLKAQNQKEYYHYILDLKPERVIFNPGAENPELEKLLSKKNIETVNGCTLVMLQTGTY
ncbi:MAG: CoA-binding protein [Owenweeksia sp.]|nr:CoA-binding protein [Owenweeksia sp.]